MMVIENPLLLALSGFVGNHLKSDHAIMCLCVCVFGISQFPHYLMGICLCPFVCPCASLCSTTGSKEACYSDLLLTSAFGQQVCMCVSVCVYTCLG